MGHRCISVNSQFEHEFFSNSVYPHAILIDDINEDNKNELIIGCSNGEIFVYKSNMNYPWLKFTKSIGCITCMAFDSVTNSKRKYLIVHDAIGYVYLLSINQVYARKRYASDISSAKSNPTDWKLDLRIVYQTKLMANSKSLIIDDLYNNGYKRMIVLYSDRSIRIYNWLNTTNNNPIASSINTNNNNYNIPFQESGKFFLEQAWHLPDQIGSMHVVKDFLNSKDLIASQPGGRIILCKFPIDASNESNSSSTSSITDLTYNQSTISVKSSNFSNNFEEIFNFSSELSQLDTNRLVVPTFLITNINFNKSNKYAYVITMHGDIFFFKMCSTNFQNKTPIWHRNINIIVMKYYKVDINNDENDELLISTPDGQIFLINCSGEIICFDFGEPIRAFHIGLYSSELFTSSVSLADPGTSSELDICHSNTAFDMTLDASSNSFQNDSSLCAVFISAITNKICVIQTEVILPYSKKKPSSSQFRYKCENIFSSMKDINPKLAQALEKLNDPILMNEVANEIFYF